MKLHWKKPFFLFLFISSLIVGCETCDDCGPVNNSPYFNLSIFNSTSLDTLQVDSMQFEINLANIDTLINELEAAIEIDTLDMEAEFQRRIDSALVQDTLYTDSLAIVKNIIRDIKDRLISVESVNGVNNLFMREEDESDSASTFRIPLNAGSFESAYEIKIGNSTIEKFLRVTYTLEDTVVNNRVSKSAKNLKVEAHDFDSIRGPFGCSPVVNCSSNQLNIYVEI